MLPGLTLTEKNMNCECIKGIEEKLVGLEFGKDKKKITKAKIPVALLFGKNTRNRHRHRSLKQMLLVLAIEIIFLILLLSCCTNKFQRAKHSLNIKYENYGTIIFS